MTDSDQLEFDQSDDALVCEYCGRPFTRPDLLALHRGQAHPEEMTDDHEQAFADAYEDEQAAIRRFRLKAIGALILLYFGFLMIYAVV